MINILNLFGWSTWLIIIFFIILVFWLLYGGKNEYEFIGVKPLSMKTLFEDLPIRQTPLINSYSMYQSNLDKLKNPKSKNCKGEDIVAEVLENILSSKVERNIRPNFLRNPSTGKNLELDCYNEEYAIAVEYNGIQHYKYPSAFHKSEEEFYEQLKRDRLKKKLCDDNGVYLIPVPYWVDNFGSEDGHINESKRNFISREVKYERIYKYLYEKIKEYFEQIFPKEKDLSEEDYHIETEDELETEDFDTEMEDDESLYSDFTEDDD
jgi:hypothetical protein